MPRNPARTFALVNLAIFSGAVAAVLWLRPGALMPSADTPDPAGEALPASDTGSVASFTLEDVQPARASQLDFINEVLTDPADTVTAGFSLQVPHAAETNYYVAAPIVRTASSSDDSVRVGVWRMRGPADAPRTVASMNAAAETYSIASRPASAGDNDTTRQAAVRLLLQRVAQDG